MEPTTLERYEGLIGHLRSLVGSEEFMERHRQKAKDFSRKRCLTFETVVLFLINMVKRALQDELDEYFRALRPGQPVAERVVSKSAFSQARKKLKYSAFMELNEAQLAYFYEHFESQRWHGWRLLAIDGSLADVPDTPELRKHFGVWGSRHGHGSAKGRLSQLFDVLNQVTLEATIQPKNRGERDLAATHLAQLGSGDLLLLDRGYPAFWLFAAIIKQNAHFCARLEVNKWKIAQRFIKSGALEQRVTLFPSSKARRDCRERGLPLEPLTLRLIRVDLPDNEVEVLISSLLDPSHFTYPEFKELYFQRWPVEEDYKVIKSRLQVENWSGRSVEAVYQDFYATIFTKNLAAIVAQPAQQCLAHQTSTRKHPYQINMTNLISKLKDTLLHLFHDLDLPPLFQALWHQMLRTIEPVRPNRSFPRKKPVERKRFPMNYKSTR